MNMKADQQVLTVIGLGYVGLPLALLAHKKGYQVVGIDIDSKKIQLIKNGKSPFKDESVEKQLKTTHLEATTDYSRVSEANIIVICVPTPVLENRLPDYKPIKSACHAIAQHLRKGQLVILESTVNPGTCDEIVLPILVKESGLSEEDFYLAHCPERINPGDEQWNVSNLPRVVGGKDQASLKKAVRFYQSIITADIKPMGSLKEAEAVKVVENSFRNVNIAFVNELARSFDKLGINIVNVIDGATTKPFAFMPHYPGCGIGGHCIPVDPYYLISYAKKNGFRHNFLALACQVNEEMPKFTAQQVVTELQELGLSIKGAKVAVLGLAYKANIGDYRESPAFEVIKHLEQLGAKVISYDPYVLDKSTAGSLTEALQDAVAVVVTTAHNQFKKLAPDQLKTYGVRLVVDGRNCLDKSKFQRAGLRYKGIGI